MCTKFYSVRQRLHLEPGHSARVRYLLCTNVNTPFFQVPTIEFGHRDGARARPCTRPNVGVGSLCPHNFCKFWQSTTLFSLLSSCFKMACDRAKWSNYVHSHISDTQGVNTTPFCACTQTLVPGHQVWTPLRDL